MKRNVKIKARLTLNRETLRNLEAAELTDAQGGANSQGICQITQSCFATYCVCVTQQSCPTNCGQWYCYGV